MRWEGLFADLEGQLAAEERRNLDDEVAERTRRERALVTLSARLAGAVGSPIRLRLVGGTTLDGRLLDLGEDWVLVHATEDAREVLLPVASMVTLAALAQQSSLERSARRFGLGYALRALSRDRATVSVVLAHAGAPLLGTIDAVGADHLDLAEHAEELPRRRENVRVVTTVPFAALVSVTARR